MVYRSFVTGICAFLLGAAVACSKQDTPTPENKPQNPNANALAATQQPQSVPDPKAAKPQTEPAKNITPADIAKLKWLQGSWLGKGADKPFFNTYKFTGTTLDVAGFDDEAMTKQNSTAHYELKDGVFGNPDGKDRFAASEITDDHVQFVTLTGTSEAYRLEKQGDGTVKATLEWTGDDGRPNKRTYTLEPLKK